MAYRTDNLWAMIKKMATGGGTFMYTPFKSIFCDPVNGNDAYDGLTLTSAKKTLAKAYDLATTGKNDTIYLVANGASTGTARVDAAFDWAKDATHLVGICPTGRKFLRARIAPTSTTTAFAAFFTVSGSGCLFESITWWPGFATGHASSIGMTITGDFNRFQNCHLAGMCDAASAGGTGARAVVLTGADDNEFFQCTFGTDTVARTALNALVEFTGGSARNCFIECNFLAWTTTAQTQLDLLFAAAACADRYQIFDRCRFINALFAVGYLVQTAICSCVGSAGSLVIFKDCTLIGRTGFGKDATTRAYIRIDGGAPAAATSGLAVAPTA